MGTAPGAALHLASSHLGCEGRHPELLLVTPCVRDLRPRPVEAEELACYFPEEFEGELLFLLIKHFPPAKPCGLGDFGGKDF